MRKFEISIILGLGLAFFLTSFSTFAVVCDEIREDTLRLHILANSDTDADQALKLKVRDDILALSENIFTTANTKQTAIQSTDDNLQLIANTAKKTIIENGYDYDVVVYRTNMFFDTRIYDTYTLPAGKYDAIRIEIGEGLGKNWWCVMFPPLCVPSAEKTTTEVLDDVYTQDETKIVSGGYEVKFALLELFEMFFN